MAATPEKLEIKHGLFYKTREGLVVGPATLHRVARSVGDKHPWQIGFWSYDDSGSVYRGSVDFAKEYADGRDIVAEASAPETVSAYGLLVAGSICEVPFLENPDAKWRHDAALAVFLVLMKEPPLADSSEATVARIAVEHADELIKALREKKSWTPPNVSDV